MCLGSTQRYLRGKKTSLNLIILHGCNAVVALQQLMVWYENFKEMHYAAWLQCFWCQPKDICVECKQPLKVIIRHCCNAIVANQQLMLW